MSGIEGPARAHQSLDSQFAHPESIRIGEEEIEVYDISPEKLKTEVPTVLAPGFSATPMAHEQNIIGLAESGRRVISVNTPHGLEQPTVSGLHENEFPEVELAKLSAVMQALEERKIEVVDVVAHSEGAMYMLIAAYLNPGRFRNMVLVNPGGLVGKRNIFKLAKGFISGMIADGRTEAKRTDTEDRQDTKQKDPLIPMKVLASNLSRTWQSVQAIQKSDLVDILEELHTSGVGISIIHGVDDQTFPMDEMQKTIKKGAVNGFYSVKGGHIEIFTRPKQYTGAVDIALDALEHRADSKQWAV
jgi:pimeloyl-ACP methyl ester carboxylesterase